MKKKDEKIKLAKFHELYQEYPWLKVTTTVEDYIEPGYYDRLLKDYIFENKKDIDIFKDFLKGIDFKKHSRILELGCGSGRVTSSLVNENSLIKYCKIELVDLSVRMLSFCQELFKSFDDSLLFIKSDSIDYLNKTKKKYDLIFSLWSFSHSIHQILTNRGVVKGREYITDVLEKTVKDNMKKGSSFFFIHFDSLSDEQKILIRQWKRVFPIFENNNIQSPSKQLLDTAFKKMGKDGLIDFNVKHLIGEQIVYESMDKALEIFLNFHMESYFNESILLPEIIDDLKSYFKKFQKNDGKIYIKPGCFIYIISKK